MHPEHIARTTYEYRAHVRTRQLYNVVKSRAGISSVSVVECTPKNGQMATPNVTMTKSAEARVEWSA